MTFWAGLMVVLGVAVLVVNWQYMSEFRAYCQEVAREKGEGALLDSPVVRTEGGLNEYREKLDQAIEGGVVDHSLSAALQARVAHLQRRRFRASWVTFVYFVLLVMLGFCLRW